MHSIPSASTHADIQKDQLDKLEIRGCSCFRAGVAGCWFAVGEAAPLCLNNTLWNCRLFHAHTPFSHWITITLSVGLHGNLLRQRKKHSIHLSMWSISLLYHINAISLHTIEAEHIWHSASRCFRFAKTFSINKLNKFLSDRVVLWMKNSYYFLIRDALKKGLWVDTDQPKQCYTTWQPKILNSLMAFNWFIKQ